MPARALIAALGCMGAKYIPSIKDLKANQRFQKKQALASKTKPSAPSQPAKKKSP